MKKIIVVYNPRSSRFKDVRKEVLDEMTKMKGVMVGKYEVAPTNIEDNVGKFAKIVQDGDTVIAAGGDATAVIAVNGILTSGKQATLAVLPYGNFNDLARTLGTEKLSDISEAKETKLWPLEIVVDGKHFRYASCYVTIGMTAEAVELFDNKKVRKEMQKGHKSSWRSYLQLAGWYFKHRKRKVFLPEFKLNGVPMNKKTSDYAALNGRSMARAMKGGDWYKKPEVFMSETGKLTNFFNLFNLMAKSILTRVPGEETRGDIIEFVKPATVEVQAEGEYKVFENISKIEIRKAKKCLKVMQK